MTSDRTISMARIDGVDCPERCDPDCEAGARHCGELHLPRFKRVHDPDECDRRTGVLPQLS